MMNLIVASILAFSIYMGFGIIIPVLPGYVEMLGGSATAVGVLLASFMFTRAFLAGPFGRLSDRVGRKRVMISGMFLYSLLAFLFTVPDHWLGLIAVRVLQGTASAMVWPAGEALIVDSTPPDKRSRAISVYMILTNVGFVAGPLLGGGILYWTEEVLGMDPLSSMRVPFYFTSGFSLIGALSGLILLKNVLDPSTSRKKRAKRPVLDGIKGPVRRSLNVLYANSFIEGFSFLMISAVMYFFLKYYFGIGARDFSVLVGVVLGIAILFVIPAGAISDRFARKPIIVTGNLIGSLFTVLLPMSLITPLGRLFALGSYSLREIGLQSASPAMRALQADLVPERIRGRLIGNLHQFNNLGAALGSMVGGALWDLAGGISFSAAGFVLPARLAPFFLSGALTTASALLVWRLVLEPRRDEQNGWSGIGRRNG